MTPNERAKAALRYQNRKNRAQGAFFEQMINGACDFYRSRQIADIEKTPEPMQPTKDLGGGKFIAHYTSTAQADYKGFLFGGRAVNFEAKYTDVEKMTQDRVTADQTERLERALATVRDDPYYRALSGKYLDDVDDRDIAEALECDTSTVWRHRKRLVQRVAVWLYGAEALR